MEHYFDIPRLAVLWAKRAPWFKVSRSRAVLCKFACRKIPRYRRARAATETTFRSLLSYFLSTYLSDLTSHLSSHIYISSPGWTWTLPASLSATESNFQPSGYSSVWYSPNSILLNIGIQYTTSAKLPSIPQTYPRLLGIKWYITSRTDDRRKFTSSEKVLFSPRLLFFLSDFLPFFHLKPL